VDQPAPHPPLEGVRVPDCGTVYAAPITAMLLGDFGADVIKVEHPRGDPARTHVASPTRPARRTARPRCPRSGWPTGWPASAGPWR
jgi:crotonobetainyl-CoA:carnitine CoA-transferase CaiB-like acyl-CoA transferase